MTEFGKWHLIESAPRDGTELLGYRDDAGVLLIRWTSLDSFLTDTEMEQYDRETCKKEGWFFADFIGGGRLERDETPTHWMHLPPMEGIKGRSAVMDDATIKALDASND